MSELRGEIVRFLSEKKERESSARQLAALQIVCHVDISACLSAEPLERSRVILRLERMLERERLRGARRHWSYDLNRHIALKQALDRLREAQPIATALRRKPDGTLKKQNGARRRRSRSDEIRPAP